MGRIVRYEHVSAQWKICLVILTYLLLHNVEFKAVYKYRYYDC